MKLRSTEADWMVKAWSLVHNILGMTQIARYLCAYRLDEPHD